MSAAESQRYGTVVVIGGGCYGSYYLRQLRRARAAGAISWRRVSIVDRDPACRVGTELGTDTAPDRPEGVHLVEADWNAFVADWLPDGQDDDALVPSPLMPHLLFDWLLSRARARWPARLIDRVALDRPPAVPWQRGSSEGTHYVSFAEWTCPINCIEPVRCPVTRGTRTWSLPPAVRAYADAERRRGHAMHGPLLFHCTHRAYGVGMIDARDVRAADAAVQAAGTDAPTRVLVGTVSHCHGALDLLAIGATGTEHITGARG